MSLPEDPFIGMMGMIHITAQSPAFITYYRRLILTPRSLVFRGKPPKAVWEKSCDAQAFSTAA